MNTVLIAYSLERCLTKKLSTNLLQKISMYIKKGVQPIKREREKKYGKELYKGTTLTEKAMLADCFLLLVQKTLNLIVQMHFFLNS